MRRARLLLLLPLLVTAVAMLACTVNATVARNGDLNVDFTQTVFEEGVYAYHLQGDVTATYFCGATEVGQVSLDGADSNASSQDGAFTAVEKKVTGSLSQPVPPPEAAWVSDCVTPLRVTAQWTNIVIENLTNGFDIDVPDTSTSIR